MPIAPSRRLTTLPDALRSGPPVLATFVMIPRVEIVELLATAGFTAVIIDLEHGAITAAQLPALTAAAQGRGLYIIVRLASSNREDLARMLDIGADGVLVPHVSQAADARQLVAAARFPPDGDRSLNPYVRAIDFGRRVHNLAEVNHDVAVLAMIEGMEAVDNLDAISAVAGLDGLFLGTVDLSADLGHPGEPDHPEVVGTIKETVRRMTANGLCSGIYAPTPEAADRWFAAGVRLVALSADVAMALNGFSTTRTAVRSEGPS